MIEKQPCTVYATVNNLHHSVCRERNRLLNENIDEMDLEQLRQVYQRTKDVLLSMASEVNELHNQTGWSKAYQAGYRAGEASATLAGTGEQEAQS